MRGLLGSPVVEPASVPATPSAAVRTPSALSAQEDRVFQEFSRQFQIHFNRAELLKLALTHRSYLTVTGQGSRESNERLEFLGDSVLGLVTSEFLYREHPTEHEGQLTKTKSLLVSKAILSRRALAMGLGRFVLMSHSESESGGRQRLSILADAFESVIGAIYLDQGFEAARGFIHRWLLHDSREIAADKRHANYKSHLQEYVQSTYRTHPVYRIRSEMGPDHSKQFNVEVMVGRRVLGTGRGRNKKDAEQAAARNALEQVETRRGDRPSRGPAESSGGGRESSSEREGRGEREARPERESRGAAVVEDRSAPEGERDREHRRRRRGGRPGREEAGAPTAEATPEAAAPSVRPLPPPASGRPELRVRRRPVEEVTAAPPPPEMEPRPSRSLWDDDEEIGRPDDVTEERRVDPFATEGDADTEAPERPLPFVGGRTVERLGWSESIPHAAPAAEPGPRPGAERRSERRGSSGRGERRPRPERNERAAPSDIHERGASSDIHERVASSDVNERGASNDMAEAPTESPAARSTPPASPGSPASVESSAAAETRGESPGAPTPSREEGSRDEGRAAFGRRPGRSRR